jgi:hypothetical protein
MTQSIEVELTISPEEFLAHYQGSARDVVAIAIDGRKVRFPSRILQPFVTHQGINGCFIIDFDGQGRFLRINRRVTR